MLTLPPTTAAYLAAFRDELVALDFGEIEVWTLVEFAAKQIIANGSLEVHPQKSEVAA